MRTVYLWMAFTSQGRSHWYSMGVVTWPLFQPSLIVSHASFWSILCRLSNRNHRFLVFLMSRCHIFTLKNTPETFSDSPKIQKFPGGACPQTPLANMHYARVIQVPHPTQAIRFYPTTSNVVAIWPCFMLQQHKICTRLASCAFPLLNGMQCLRSREL